MGRSISHSNVDFVVKLHNGFAGEILTFVMSATKDRLLESISQEFQNKNWQNAKAKANVQSAESMG